MPLELDQPRHTANTRHRLRIFFGASISDCVRLLTNSIDVITCWYGYEEFRDQQDRTAPAGGDPERCVRRVGPRRGGPCRGSPRKRWSAYQAPEARRS